MHISHSGECFTCIGCVCVCLRERGGIFVFVREELEVGVNVYSCIPRLQTTVNSSMCHLRFLLKFFLFCFGVFLQQNINVVTTSRKQSACLNVYKWKCFW